MQEPLKATELASGTPSDAFSLVLLSKQLDLEGDSVDALIETLPVADEVLEDVEQARSEHVGARGEDAGSASRSRCKP